MKGDEVEDYWFKHYMDEHCTLCGNSGVIDTTGAKTATGLEVGRRNFCLCPNGRAMREHSKTDVPAEPIDKPQGNYVIESLNTLIAKPADLRRAKLFGKKSVQVCSDTGSTVTLYTYRGHTYLTKMERKSGKKHR